MKSKTIKINLQSNQCKDGRKKQKQSVLNQATRTDIVLFKELDALGLPPLHRVVALVGRRRQRHGAVVARRERRRRGLDGHDEGVTAHQDEEEEDAEEAHQREVRGVRGRGAGRGRVHRHGDGRAAAEDVVRVRRALR